MAHNAAGDLYAQLLFAINRLSTPVTQLKLRKPSKVCQLRMELLKATNIFNKTGGFLLLTQVYRLQQDFLTEPELRFKRREMPALSLPNPYRMTSHIFKPRSLPNSSAIPNLIIFNNLSILQTSRKHSMHISSLLSLTTICHILQSTP